jgi:hypothetical protein
LSLAEKTRSGRRSNFDGELHGASSSERRAVRLKKLQKTETRKATGPPVRNLDRGPSRVVKEVSLYCQFMSRDRRWRKEMPWSHLSALGGLRGYGLC